MNVKTHSVELRTSSQTTDTGALQKGEDFVKAFTLGFDVDDAIALLRLVCTMPYLDKSDQVC
jgi:RNA-binding protein PNO1